MKKQYIEPSVQIHRIQIESSLMGQSDPPASGVQQFIDERTLDLAPEVLDGEKIEFIEGD